jgi:hypothetical protein
MAAAHEAAPGFRLAGRAGTPPERRALPRRSHDRKRGAAWRATAAGAPRGSCLLLTPESDLATYRFNRKKIQHHYCALCGVAPFAEGVDGAGTPTAAINVRCLEGVDLAGLKVVPFDRRSL